MTLRAVFIDVGNTLLYEDPSRFRIYAQAAEKRGLAASEASSDRLKRLMSVAHAEIPIGAGPPVRGAESPYRYGKAWFREFIRRIFHGGLGLPKSELPGLEAELFAHFDDPRSYRLREGVVENLSTWAARDDLVLGVISNGTDRLPQLLDDLKLAPYFDFVLSSGLFGHEKPQPEIFREALRLAQVRPEEACHIGDSLENDVRGALQCGISAILFDPAGLFGPAGEASGYDSEEFQGQPNFSRVVSFAELGKDLTERLSSEPPPPSP